MSGLFLLNLLLAAGFAVLIGRVDITGFLSGFALGYLALWISRPLYGATTYFGRVPRILRLMVYFVRELAVSNLRVLWDVLTPRHISKPGVVAVPLTAQTDLEITLVANLVSLTPGTLSLDVSTDRQTLYVHLMFLDDVAQARRQIKEGIEKKVLEALR